MADRDESRILRRRHDELSASIDAGRNGGRPGVAAIVGKVFDAGAMPSVVPGQFSLRVERVGGNESEGSSVSSADLATSLVAVVVGRRVPAVGDLLVARLIDGRWVAEAGRPNTTPCPCDVVPETMDVLAGYCTPSYASTFPAGVPTRFTYGAKPADIPAQVNSYSTPSNTYSAFTPPAFSWYSDKYGSGGHFAYDQLSFRGCVATIRQYSDVAPPSPVVAGGWSTTDATVSFTLTGAVNGALATILGCSPTANSCEPFYIGNAVYASYAGFGTPRNSYNEGPCLQRNGSTNITLDAAGNAG